MWGHEAPTKIPVLQMRGLKLSGVGLGLELRSLAPSHQPCIYCRPPPCLAVQEGSCLLGEAAKPLLEISGRLSHVGEQSCLSLARP